MKKTKIEIPEGCEVERIETLDGAVVVTFKEKDQQLPKSWEEFCKMFPHKDNEYWITPCSDIEFIEKGNRSPRSQYEDKNILPDRATAEAVLALCQLIQLRDIYNGDFSPIWDNLENTNFTISMFCNEFVADAQSRVGNFLYFKSKELRNKFLRNFRPLIEKLNPLYGIKEGGEE